MSNAGRRYAFGSSEIEIEKENENKGKAEKLTEGDST